MSLISKLLLFSFIFFEIKLLNFFVSIPIVERIINDEIIINKKRKITVEINFSLSIFYSFLYKLINISI